MPPTLVRQHKATPKRQPRPAPEPGSRRYIYCVIDCGAPKDFTCAAIGNASRVHTVVHRGIGAVVSPSPKPKYPIDRHNALAHQRVMEHVMAQGHTVLPVKFNTIAEAANGLGPEERIVQHVLAKRFGELASLLAAMSTRAEVGLKALWRQRTTVFEEIVNSSQEIRRLRNQVARAEGQTPVGALVTLGERVKHALDAKKEREHRELLDTVRGLVVDVRTNKTFGDQMFANFAFLVERSQLEALDRKLGELAALAAERIQLRYVGPLPPSNFIELSIRWDE